MHKTRVENIYSTLILGFVLAVASHGLVVVGLLGAGCSFFEPQVVVQHLLLFRKVSLHVVLAMVLHFKLDANVQQVLNDLRLLIRILASNLGQPFANPLACQVVAL